MENTEHIIYLNNSKNIEALYERLKISAYVDYPDIVQMQHISA